MHKFPVRILSIETSCDETAVSLLEFKTEKNFKILGNALYSQIEKHKEFGGVFPMLAKREHGKNLVPLLIKVLQDSQLYNEKNSEIDEDEINKQLDREPELLEQFIKEIPKIDRPKIDAIAVTEGPGLEPALWVGINFAKALSVTWNIPIIPINHMEGHIISALIKSNTDGSFNLNEIEFPALSLLISGGHTQLVLVKNIGDYQIVGDTRDDAIGEAFDKVARILGLPYPGGPEISRLAQSARDKNLDTSKYKLPRPMINSNDFDFSFSGIKTAVLYMTKKIGNLTDEIKESIAKEFEDAVTEVLIKKITVAISKYNIKTLITGGGVIANRYIKEKINELVKIKSIFPSHELSTDNSIMIGVAGFIRFEEKIINTSDFKASGNLRLDLK